MKRFLSVLLALVMACSLIACGSQAKEEETVSKQEEKENDSSAEGKKTFFINPKNIGPAYWAAAEKGAKKAG